MDPAFVSGLSAILGSLVGGSATIATAWITQRSQGRRELIGAQVRNRELLYSEFITECSKRAVDSLDHNLDHPAKLLQVYALLNRIRLSSSDKVVAAADQAVARILEQYYRPNLSQDKIRALALSRTDDPLKAFSEACRSELNAISNSA